MLSHERIWAAIDALAERYGLTASGLARKAGLDPTSFNRSKRTSPEGRERWPSTESIAKILRATGATTEEFVTLVNPNGAQRPTTVPAITDAELGRRDLFAPNGLPARSEAWQPLEVSNLSGDRLFALKVTGDAFLPAYRGGDVLILSPAGAPRRGDRVVVRTRGGEVVIGMVLRRFADALVVRPVARANEEQRLESDEIEGVARIVWARYAVTRPVRRTRARRPRAHA